MTHPSPALPHSLYRAYLKNLQHIPDPHIWRTHQPYFRSLLDRPRGRPHVEPDVNNGETSAANLAEYAKEGRRLRGLVRAKQELNKLRAATACHPHALRRLIEEAYGQRGRVRWELINNIIKSNPPDPNPPDPPLPAPLLPLVPKAVAKQSTTRLRPIPDVAVRKAAHRAWERSWREVGVPIALPANGSGWATGWEGMGILESMRILAGIDTSTSTPTSDSTIQSEPTSTSSPAINPLFPPRPLPRDLPTYPHLSPHVRLLIPKRPPPAPSREEGLTYPLPRPASTRQNPRTWAFPRVLRTRLIRRMYHRVWNSLRWVKETREGTWVEGKYADVMGDERSGEGVEVRNGRRKSRKGD